MVNKSITERAQALYNYFVYDIQTPFNTISYNRIIKKINYYLFMLRLNI